MKEPFTIDDVALHKALGIMPSVDLLHGAKIAQTAIAAQIHAHDPSLPETLEEQLRELFGRAEAGQSALEDEREERRMQQAHAIELEKHLRAVLAYGWPAGTTGPACVRAAYEALVTKDPSIGNPFEPPPPPPTKAVEGES